MSAIPNWRFDLRPPPPRLHGTPSRVRESSAKGHSRGAYSNSDLTRIGRTQSRVHTDATIATTLPATRMTDTDRPPASAVPSLAHQKRHRQRLAPQEPTPSAQTRRTGGASDRSMPTRYHPSTNSPAPAAAIQSADASIACRFLRLASSGSGVTAHGCVESRPAAGRILPRPTIWLGRESD